VAKKGETLFAAHSRMSSVAGRRGGPERDSRRGTVFSAEMPNDPGTAAGAADTDAAAADVSGDPRDSLRRPKCRGGVRSARSVRFARRFMTLICSD